MKSAWPLLLCASGLTALGCAWLAGVVPALAVKAVICVSMLSFCAHFIARQRSAAGRSRVSRWYLLALDSGGGWPGACLERFLRMAGAGEHSHAVHDSLQLAIAVSVNVLVALLLLQVPRLIAA